MAISALDTSKVLTLQEGEHVEPVDEATRTFLADALQKFKLVEETESTMRQEMREDRRFRASDQWPDTIKNDRVNDDRPCLTINRIPEFVRQVTNAQRMNRPGVKVSPVDSQGDVDTGQVLQGLIRNVETQSDADIAYTQAGIDQVELGRGYWRLQTVRPHPRSMDLEVRIKRIANPFSVYVDPTYNEPDGSDARFAFIIEDLPRREFESRYGDAPKSSLTEFSGTGNPMLDWFPEGKVRIAEYFYVEDEKKELLELQMTPTLATVDMYEDEWDDLVASGEPYESTNPADWVVLSQATTTERTVKWCLISGANILEGNEDLTGGRDWPGKFIPIIPVLGDEVIVNGERDIRGMIRDARDVQRMINYWESALTEQIALAPKAPFVGAHGQFENHEKKWNTANRRNWAYLEYNPVDSAGKPIPPPERSVTEPPIQATVIAADRAERSLQSVMGFHDASLGNITQQERSGKAIESLQRQAELGSSNYLDNLGRAIRFSGRQLIDIIPKIYNRLQIVRILGEDDAPQQIMIHAGDPNAPQQPPDGISGIYDLGVGRYDVTVNSGRSFETRRQETSEMLNELIKSNPDITPLVADIMVENLDMPYARKISARLKTLLPPGFQDNDALANLPPAAQHEIARLTQAVQERDQQLEELTQMVQADSIKQSGQLQIKKLETDSRERIAAQATAMDLRIAQLEANIDLIMARLKAATDLEKADAAEVTKRGTAVLSAKARTQGAA